jgi:hypothetical protein
MADHNATVSQTLPAVTQTATGETDFFSAFGNLVISSSVALSFSNDEKSTGLITESVQYIEERSATGSMVIDGTVEFNREVSATGSMTIDDRTAHTWDATVRADEMFIGSSVEFSITVPITEALTIEGTAEHWTVASATEALTIDGRTTESLSVTVSAKSTLNIEARAEIGLVETAGSTITIDDSTQHDVVATQTATGSMTITDSYSHTVDLFQAASSSMVISELTTYNGSVFTNNEGSTFYIDDKTWAPDFGALAWVLNTETGGLATYDNFGFTSIAYHDGTLFAASPSGLFSIDNDTDDGRFVSASVQTGFMDFNSDRIKRVSDVFVGHTGGQLELDVETYDGPEEVYTYTMEERDADAPRNNRAKIGRGLQSRYWRFTFRNLDGADIQVYDVSSVVGESNRRL